MFCIVWSIVDTKSTFQSDSRKAQTSTSVTFCEEQWFKIPPGQCAILMHSYWKCLFEVVFDKDIKIRTVCVSSIRLEIFT